MYAGSNPVIRIVSITLLGLVVGALSSVAAIGFVSLIEHLNDWLLISPRSRIMAPDTPWLLAVTIGVPAAGGLVVGLVHLLIPERRAHGPPDVVRAVQGMDGKIPLRTGLLSAVSATVSLGAGASVGQYGPLAHLGATLGCAVAAVKNDSQWMATIGVGCGVAAAISTAFNAPIAGIIFAHEVILRHYSLRAFAPITVASTTGYLVANVVFERRPLFHVEPTSVAYAPEFALFILIGICGAFLAVLYMRAILFSNELAGKVSVPSYLKPMAAGAILGCVAIWLPDVLGIGKETLRFAMIEQAFGPAELALLLVAKILATALCIGFGFAGGVFSPALLIGILFGALAGNGAELLLGDLRSDIVIYAVCGMVAVTSAVIGAPLTTILIVFELTRNYDLATAAMASVVFSNLVSYRIFGRSLFDVQLRARGFDLSLGRDKVILDNRVIEDYVTQDYTRLDPGMSLAQARAKLVECKRHEGYLLDADGVYVGTLKLGEILEHGNDAYPPQTRIAEIARPESLILTARTTIWVAMEKMGDFVGESIPVLNDTDDPRLFGVVFEAAVVKAYLDTMYDIRREENAAT
ncbi:MAG: chloride channel protein [Gammaproteobacteria bacterium]